MTRTAPLPLAEAARQACPAGTITVRRALEPRLYLRSDPGREPIWEIRDGRYEQDRCPLRPSDGCACYFEAYWKAPWWRRWRMEKPKCPDATISAAAVVKIRVETEMLDKIKDPIWRSGGKVK